MAHELRVVVCGNGSSNFMHRDNLPKIKVSNPDGIYCLQTSYKMGHLGESIYHHKDRIYAPLSAR